MKLQEIKNIKGVNTTVDVATGETRRQAAKFGNRINNKNEPPLLAKTAKNNSSPHVLGNLGLAEGKSLDHYLQENIEMIDHPKDDKFGINLNKFKRKGDKIGRLGNLELYLVAPQHSSASEPSLTIYDPKAKRVAGFIGLSKDEYNIDITSPKSFVTSLAVVNDKYQGKGIVYKAYAAMIKMGYTLISDNSQSLGGKRIWERLAKTSGVNVYAATFPRDGDPEYHAIDPDDITDSNVEIYDFRTKLNSLRQEIDKLKYQYEQNDAEIKKLDADRKYWNETTAARYAEYSDKNKILGREIADARKEFARYRAQSLDVQTRLVATSEIKTDMTESIINEVFDKLLPIKQTGTNKFEAEIPNGKRLLIIFDLMPDTNIYEIEFNVNGDTTMTQEGYQMQIFATVIEAIRQFNTQLQPDGYVFSAEKFSKVRQDTRISLYKRLIAKFAPMINMELELDNQGWRTKFHLKRKDLVESETTQSGYGYKIMNYDPTSGNITSGADSRTTKDLRIKKGMVITMPSPGIFMSTNREYIQTYYGGHNDHEVLIKFKFDPAKITTGNLTDNENEFTVLQAQVVAFKVMNNLDETLSESANVFGQQLQSKHNLQDIWLSDMDNRNAFELSNIIIGKENQGKGVGSAVMQDIVDYADNHGKIVVLDPALKDKRHGTTSQSRLRAFYKRFGFIDNKGRNKNYEFRNLMIRYPSGKTVSKLDEVIFHVDTDKDDKFGSEPAGYIGPITGKLIASFDNFKLFYDKNNKFMNHDPTIFIVDDETVAGIIKLKDEYDDIAGMMENVFQIATSVISKRYEGKGIMPRAYAALVYAGYSLMSDNQQTAGGQRIWERLAKAAGIYVYAGVFADSNTTGNAKRHSISDPKGKSIRFYDVNPNDITDADANIFDNSSARHEAKHLETYAKDLTQKARQAASLMSKLDKTDAKYAEYADKIDMLKNELAKAKADRKKIKKAIRQEHVKITHLIATAKKQPTQSIKESTQLTELFNKSYKWNWKLDDTNTAQADFEIADGGTVSVFFISASHNSPNFEVGFQKANSLKRSGDGDQFAVFATVIAIIAEFLEKRPQVSGITFTAKREGAALDSPKIRDSRVSLYKRMIQRYAAKNNFEFVWNDVGRMTEFMLRREVADVTEGQIPVNTKYNQDRGNLDLIVNQIEGYITSDDLARFVRTVPVEALTGTQDWLSKHGGGGPVFPDIDEQYHDLPVVAFINSELIVIDGHHRASNAKGQIEVLVFPIRTPTVEAIKKPHPKDTLGVARRDMPQVHRDHYPELIKYLGAHGGNFRRLQMAATDLKAVQSEFSDAGVERMMNNKDQSAGTTRDKPLIVSSDNYIIDGHHRWLAAWNLSETVPVMQISIPVKKLFQLVKDFKHATYKDIHEMSVMERACLEGGHSLEDAKSTRRQANENISSTGTARRKQEQRKNIVPGTDAWFKHWFSLPYLRREQVEQIKNEAIEYIKEVQHEKATNPRRSNRNRRANERNSTSRC